MGKTDKWSWSSAIIGAATATAAAALVLGRPRNPTFRLVSIKPTSLNLDKRVVHLDLILTVHVTNPNVVPIQYSSSSMSIFYQGTLLGTARVDEGAQAAASCQFLRLPARLDAARLGPHLNRFVADVAKREMEIDAVVDLGGTAKVLRWGRKRFKVHVDSHLTVDPVFLDVLDQENRSDLVLFGA
ncbi:hypothetical protein Scep_003354 [Stephania cephalantha]|uniref:Water stress and hypersensitive response domain-containing protein n=1 Tax=Stephania cephalantha TaxID=152367 RepID=A0AAP0KSX7_9MAGN